jgi:hypothetical protein
MTGLLKASLQLIIHLPNAFSAGTREMLRIVRVPHQAHCLVFAMMLGATV